MAPVGRAAAQRYSELLGDPKLITGAIFGKDLRTGFGGLQCTMDPKGSLQPSNSCPCLSQYGDGSPLGC